MTEIRELYEKAAELHVALRQLAEVYPELSTCDHLAELLAENLRTLKR